MRTFGRSRRTIAARDHAAGDRAEPRDAEERAHLDLADDRLGLDRREHADERLLDLLGELVDDAVLADLDALALGELRAPRSTGRTLKPTTIAPDAAARLTSFSVMPPTPVWMTLTRTSGCSIFCSSPTIASTEPCTSPLRTMLRSATPPACSCSNSFSSETPRLRLLRERLAPEALAALLREVARAPVVLDHAAELAGRRRLVEAEDLDRIARARRLDLLAAVVVERTHAAPGVAGDDRVADLERAALHEHRRRRGRGRRRGATR